MALRWVSLKSSAAVDHSILIKKKTFKTTSDGLKATSVTGTRIIFTTAISVQPVKV